MAILGKVAGTMLKDNLVRNGVDLIVDGNLMYFDVNNRRVGINTTLPGNALTVNGNATISSVYANNFYYANGISLDSAFASLNANIGSYESFANVWLGNLQANVSTINANIVAANLAISTLQSNVGSYESFANVWFSNLQTNVSTINANISAANSAITTLTSNAASQAVDITTLYSNASTQTELIAAVNANISAANSAISSLQSNVGSYESFANVWFSNLQANVSTLTSNVASQAVDITTLYSNAASQADSISAINSNITAANSAISTLQSNVGSYESFANVWFSNLQTNVSTINANVLAANSAIGILQSNAASQAVDITTLYSNAASQAVDITTLYSNAASQAVDITTLYSNAASQAGLISTIDTNVSAANSAISTLQSNVGSYESFANVWFSNLQANVGTINANVTAANLVISTLTINAATQQTQINSLAGGANTNVAAYLTTYQGALTANNFTGVAVYAATIGNTGTNLVGTVTTASQNTISTMTGLTNFGTIGVTTVAAGNFTIAGNLTVQGNNTVIGSADLTINDSVINLHTFANLAPLTSNDGRDIGILMHYYDSSDSVAFLGRANDTGYLEFYANGYENSSNVFIGTRYGTIKSGELWAANTTASTSTATGALRVAGGAGIAGAVYANSFNGVSVYAGTIGNTGSTLTGTLSTAAQTNITSVGTLTSLGVTGTSTLSAVTASTLSAGTIGNSGASIQGTTGAFTGAVTGNTFTGKSVYAGTIGNTGANLVGTINTNAQPFITSLGTLSSVTTSGASTANSYTAVAVYAGTIGNSGATLVGTLNGAANGPLNGTIGVTTPNTGIFSDLTTVGSATIGNDIAGTIATFGYWSSGYIIGDDTRITLTGGSLKDAGVTDASQANGIFVSGLTGNVRVITTTNSTSSSTGAFIVDGGAAVKGNLYVGGQVTGYITGAIGANTANTGAFTTLSTTGAVTGNTFTGIAVYANTIGNTGATLVGTIGTNAQPFITSVGTLSSLTVTGAVQGNTHTGVAVYANTIGNTGATLVGTNLSITTISLQSGGGIIWAANSATYSSGGGGSPGGSNTMVQFNDAGSFSGSTYLQYNKTSGNLISNSTTTSTSTTTGALVLSGGIGAAGNAYVGGNVYQGGRRVSWSSSQATAPTGNVVGDFWYKTGSDILYQYVNDGTSSFWLDLTTKPTTYANISVTSNLSVSGNVNTSLIPAATNTYNLGSTSYTWATVYGTTFSGVSTTAKYADLAEKYTADCELDPGDVVVFGGINEITKTTISHDDRIAGVISTNPAYLMNSEADGYPVGLQGRLPCRVLGPVTKGQSLVASTISGVAQALDKTKYVPGCVIGKSLEDITTNEVKIIEVVVGRM